MGRVRVRGIADRAEDGGERVRGLPAHGRDEGAGAAVGKHPVAYHFIVL